jgi:hypothetical protein
MKQMPDLREAPSPKLANLEHLYYQTRASLIPPPRSLFEALKKSISYFCVTGIFLLATESILDTAGLGQEEILSLDPQLGTCHMTDKKVTWRKEGYAVSYLNNQGLREPGVQPAKAPGVLRIALLGDSQVESIQVPYEKSFSYLLQEKLTKELQRPVQVINFGVSGYSTVQEYLLFQRQVLQYAPDVVLLGYDGRDIFENWATPDQTLTNVRPMALKLPNQPLVIDENPVKAWRKSPRGRFLTAIEWLRKNSRIWGLISQSETELGFHNPLYKWLINYLTEPGKVSRSLSQDLKKQEFRAQLAQNAAGELKNAFLGQSFSIQFFEKKAPAANPQAKPADKVPEHPQARVAPSDKNARIFLNLLSNTLAGLFENMKRESAQKGATFVVVGLPSRASLAPIPGMEGDEQGLNHMGELKLVEEHCRKLKIPYIDGLSPALAYSLDNQASLFYSAHLTPKGQEYIARVINPRLYQLLKSTSLPPGETPH